MASTIKVAVTQAEPEWLDLPAAVKKTCDLITEAAEGGLQTHCLPRVLDTWLPLLDMLTDQTRARPVDFELGTKYLKTSLVVDSDSMRTIQSCAKNNSIAVLLGFSENDHHSLYIAQALIDVSGEIVMRRRKIKPTHMERTIFGDGSGNSLTNVVEASGVGRVGALNCWEHMQPLLKYNTYCQHEEIHVAAWPPLDPHPGGPALWSMSTEGCASLSQTYAVESTAFVLHATSVFTEKGINAMKTESGALFNAAGGGCSAVYGPDGRGLTKEIPSTQEGLVIAELDRDSILQARFFVDVVGHYSRPDLLWLGTDGREKKTRIHHPETNDSREDGAQVVNGLSKDKTMKAS